MDRLLLSAWAPECREEVDMGVVSLIVMEPGSDWPGHIGDSENVVAARCYEEGLFERVRHMVGALRARGEDVRVAVLSCNDAADPASAGRRAEIARELLGVVASAVSGCLVLYAAPHAPWLLRHELLSLAGGLSEGLHGSTAAVSLRFGGASEENREPPSRRIEHRLASDEALVTAGGSHARRHGFAA